MVKTKISNEVIRDIPLRNLCIRGSHNSFVGMFQWGLPACVSQLEHVLQKGYRAIELDIHNDDSILIVRHGPQKGSPLWDALEIIAREGWKDNPDLPLFLFIDDRINNRIAHNKCAIGFKDMLGERLINAAPLYKKTLNGLAGKLIIVSSNTRTESDIWNNCISAGLYSGDFENLSSNASVSDLMFDRLSRVYPKNYFISSNRGISKWSRSANFVCVNVGNWFWRKKGKITTLTN